MVAGLEELFPDAQQGPGVPLPAAQQAEPAGSRRLGILALTLGLLAVVCQVGALLTGIAVFVTLLPSLGAGLGPEGLDWVPGYELSSAILGFVLGVGALVVGVLAIRRRSGERFAATGAILGGVVVLFEVTLGVFAVVTATA